MSVQATAGQGQEALAGAGRPAPPCTVVIFGAAGDLTKRKLVPALYNLETAGLLPREFAIVGVARRDQTHEQFRDELTRSIQEFATTRVDAKLWGELRNAMYFHAGELTDPAVYAQLADLLAEIAKRHGTGGNVLFYLATPPNLFGEVVRRLREEQIYRIDHYLGKETVQNILVFRFANGLFEPIWNRTYVDHVQLTVAETVGVEDRGNYYETAGVLRDMIQNHLFQLLALVAMEPPISFAADAVRDEKVKILQAIRPMGPEEILDRTIRGQYGDGMIDGKPVPAYRKEPKVSPTSTTETYAALKLFVENWRWAGVPFYLRSGKRLARRSTEIVVEFQRPPLLLFDGTPMSRIDPNRLVLHIQPDEGIELQVKAKRPGPTARVETVKLDFSYKDFGDTPAATGYERLLYDCMAGDSTLFHRTDMVEAAWRIATPILDAWRALPAPDFPNYPAGSWGPAAADELLHQDGRRWYKLE